MADKSPNPKSKWTALEVGTAILSTLRARGYGTEPRKLLNVNLEESMTILKTVTTTLESKKHAAVAELRIKIGKINNRLWNHCFRAADDKKKKRPPPTERLLLRRWLKRQAYRVLTEGMVDNAKVAAIVKKTEE